jgi:DNA-binding transcriptional ArsR family regulator
VRLEGCFLIGRRGGSRSGAPLDAGFVAALADTMFALSTPNRVQILYALLDGPHDVSELIKTLGIEQSAVSHQLRVLREAALVRAEREGIRRVYALADEHVAELLHQAARHIEHRSGSGSLPAAGSSAI